MEQLKQTWQSNIHTIVVHEFKISDVEDPTFYVSEPLRKWKTSEEGHFIMENAVEIPIYTITTNNTDYGYKVKITAMLKEVDLLFYKLKYE